MGGKLLTIAATILALVLILFATNAASSSVIAVAEDRTADWPSAIALARGLGAGWLILGTWSLVGAFLGIVFRSTSLAVGLGLVWALAVENLVRGFAGVVGFLDTFQRWLPGTNAGSLVASLGAPTLDEPGGTPGVTAVVSGPQAAVVLMTTVVAITLAAMLAVQRQDMT